MLVGRWLADVKERRPVSRKGKIWLASGRTPLPAVGSPARKEGRRKVELRLHGETEIFKNDSETEYTKAQLLSNQTNFPGEASHVG